MKLHIGNLPKTGTDQQLKDLVSPFGDAKLELVKDSAGVSKGYAFAEFADNDQAAAAITGLNGKEVDGQVLKVAEARPRKSDMPKAVPATQA